MLGLAFSEAHKSHKMGLRLIQQHSSTTTTTKRTRRRRRQKKSSRGESSSSLENKNAQQQSSSKRPHDKPMTKSDLYFCLRCGMVRVGNRGEETAVGRVTLVNWDNQVVLDTFVKIPVAVLDYQTETTGITEPDLASAKTLTFEQVRSKVVNLVKGKILIGHGLEVDLTSLGLTHPWSDVRDTANYAPYMKEVADPLTVMLLPRDLPSLVADVLHRNVGNGPIAEAECILDLYKVAREEWECELMKLVQQKERQRQVVLAMRSSGGGSQHTGIPLSSIKEDESAKHGGPFHSDIVLLASEQEHPLDVVSSTDRTAPSTIYTAFGDDISEISSFVSSQDNETSLAPPPPGFDAPTMGSSSGVSPSEIENLRDMLMKSSGLQEVCGPSTTNSSITPGTTWSSPTGESPGPLSSQTSKNLDAWSTDGSSNNPASRPDSMNLWCPFPSVGALPSVDGGWSRNPASLQPDNKGLPPVISDTAAAISCLTEEEVLSHLPSQLLADLNEAEHEHNENSDSSRPRRPRQGSWFRRRSSKQDDQDLIEL